eukprot:6491490-Amphidinium_carterae.1
MQVTYVKRGAQHHSKADALEVVDELELAGESVVEVNVDVRVDVEVNVDDVDTPRLVFVDVLEGVDVVLKARPPRRGPTPRVS